MVTLGEPKVLVEAKPLVWVPVGTREPLGAVLKALVMRPLGADHVAVGEDQAVDE